MTAIQAVVPGFEGPPMAPAPAALPAPGPPAAPPGVHDAGLGAVEVETITETPEFQSGEHLWDWLVHSNPIVVEWFSASSG